MRPKAHLKGENMATECRLAISAVSSCTGKDPLMARSCYATSNTKHVIPFNRKARFGTKRGGRKKQIADFMTVLGYLPPGFDPQTFRILTHLHPT
jgi:hypothetical protein